MKRDRDGWLRSKSGALIGPAPKMERELTDAELERAWVFDNERVIKRGAGNNPRGRPPKAPEDRKQMVTVRLDPTVIDYFKEAGPGWQSRMNAVLRKAAQPGTACQAVRHKASVRRKGRKAVARSKGRRA